MFTVLNLNFLMNLPRFPQNMFGALLILFLEIMKLRA